MKTKLALAISSVLALSACDDYQLSSEGDNFHSVGSVEVTGVAQNEQTLTATITDADTFEADAVTYTWYRNNAPTDITSSSFVLDADDIGDYFSVKVEYTDNAGYDEVAISGETDVVEEIPVQSAGSVAIDGNAYIGIDIEAVITDSNGSAENDITYTWMADGVAIAGATESEYEVAATDLGKTITVSVSYIDDDGFEEVDLVSAPTAEVIEKPAEVVLNNVASITDTMDDDAGELRFKKSGDLITDGKLNVSFYRPSDLNADSGSSKDAYIAIYGQSTSTSDAYIDLRIHGESGDAGYGTFEVRNSTILAIGDELTDDDGATYNEGLPFTENEWHDVEITWDATSSTDLPTITVQIDGGVVYSYESVTTNTIDTAEDGVNTVIYKVGDTSAVIPANKAFLIDDFVLTDNNADTPTVFSDDFEAYDKGYNLDLTDNPDSLYHASSADAVVAQIEVKGGTDGGTGGETGDENLLSAAISDTMTDDAGELRYKKSGDLITKGSIEVSFLREAMTETSEGSSKDAYIALYGQSTSTSDAIVDLRIHGPTDPATYGTFEIRNSTALAIGSELTDGDGVKYNEGVPFDEDEWVDVIMTWDATSSSDLPTITVQIDGGTVYSFESASEDSVGKDADGVNTVIFKLGDTSATLGNRAFYIDDFKLYEFGNTVPVFEDDFEGYSEGTDLDKTNNTDSLYHASSADVIVDDRP